jgi:hypothetical protein
LPLLRHSTAGTYSDLVGRTNVTDCVPAPAGYYVGTNGMTVSAAAAAAADATAAMAAATAAAAMAAATTAAASATAV